MSHQKAENGGGEQHAVPASHTQEAGLGALLHPEHRGPGLDGTDGTISRPGCGGCCCATGELQRKRETPLQSAAQTKCVSWQRKAERKNTDLNFEMFVHEFLLLLMLLQRTVKLLNASHQLFVLFC